MDNKHDRYIKNHDMQQVHLYVPRSIKELMKESASKLNMSMTEFITMAVSKFVSDDINESEKNRIFEAFREMDTQIDSGVVPELSGDFRATRYIYHLRNLCCEEEPERKLENDRFFNFNNMVNQFIFTVEIWDLKVDDTFFVTLTDPSNVDNTLKVNRKLPYVITKRCPYDYNACVDVKDKIDDKNREALYNIAFELLKNIGGECEENVWCRI